MQGDTIGRVIRVGVMLDGLVADAWIARTLERVLALPEAALCVCVLNADGTERPAGGGRAGLGEYLRFVLRAPFHKHHLYEQYVAEDQRYFGSSPRYNEPEDLGGLLDGVPRVRVSPARKGFCDYFDDAALAAIGAHAPDVLLRFGFRILKGRILTVAPLGVWSYHHGDNRFYRGGPALFWEMVENAPASGVVLQRLTEDLDAGLVLYRSLSPTFRHSLFANRNQTYFKSAAFVARVLRDVHRRGWQTVEAEARQREEASPKGRLFRTPTNRQVLKYLASRRRRFRAEPKRYEERWNILMARASGSEGLPPSDAYQRLENPPGVFRADPCLHERDGSVWLFFEEYSYSSRKGVIACAEVLPGPRLGAASTVLERPYHLSAPQVFSWEGETFLLPESCDNGTVELYRCKRFPGQWELESVLLDGVCGVDAKLLRHEGRWWLFVNVAEPGASTWDELHLYHAEDLRGPWRPHVGNPVVSDVRFARPAGELFYQDGRLMRPSQDCSGCYGRALNIMQVERLDTQGYAERPALRCAPEAFGAQGVHSRTAAGGWVALDCKRLIPSREPWAAKRMAAYPFLPVVWPMKHLFPPLARLERVGVKLLKRLLGRR